MWKQHWNISQVRPSLFWFRTFLRAVVGLARCALVDGLFWNLLGPSLLECPLNFLCALDEPNPYKMAINLLFLCALLNVFLFKENIPSIL